MINRLLFSIIVFALIGCSKGPSPDALQQEVQMRLDERYAQSLFTIAEFDRRGHQPFQQQDNQGIIVYYKATLTFTRDHRLSDWDLPGTSSLLSLLGATNSGVIGVNPDGNKKGDELVVYGLLSFGEENGAWQVTSYQLDNLSEPSVPAKTFSSEDELAEELYFDAASSQQVLTSAVTDLFKQLNNQNDTQYTAILESELTSIITRGQAHLATSQGNSVFVSGSNGGVYHSIGAGINALVKDSLLDDVEVITSLGAIENLRLLRDGKADFAISQSDLAILSYEGKGPYSGNPDTHLRGLVALYPEAIQILTRDAPGIESLADLTGKRINIGVQGSGGRVNALTLLDNAGIDVYTSTELDTVRALEALSTGEIDAMIVTTGYPNQAFQSPPSGLKLIAIDADIRASMVANNGFINVTLQEGTYVWQSSSVQTLGVTAVLLTREHVSNDKVSALVDAIYTQREVLSGFATQASYINRNNAKEGIQIPIHDAIAKSSSQSE